MKSKGFGKIEILIWLSIVFIGISIALPVYLKEKHIKKMELLYQSTEKLNYKQESEYMEFWNTLDIQLKKKYGTVSVTQKQKYEENFINFLNLKKSDNELILLKQDGSIAKPKSLICELYGYNPDKTFAKPACPGL